MDLLHSTASARDPNAAIQAWSAQIPGLGYVEDDRKPHRKAPASRRHSMVSNYSCSFSHEEVALALGVFDALAGDAKVIRVSLDPDESHAHLNGRDASAP